MSVHNIVELFVERFKTNKISNWEQISYLISVNKEVREWYVEIQNQRSAESEMPESYKEAGVTAEEWNNLSKERELIRKSNKDFADRTLEAVNDYKNKLEKITRDKKEATNGRLSPLSEILHVTVNELSTGEVFSLASIVNFEDRKLKQSEAVKRLQIKLINDFREGRYISPFN